MWNVLIYKYESKISYQYFFMWEVNVLNEGSEIPDTYSSRDIKQFEMHNL